MIKWKNYTELHYIELLTWQMSKSSPRVLDFKSVDEL